MKSLFSKIKLTHVNFLSVFPTATLAILMLCQIGQAQQVQLNLADILIGLRSKKATMPEKNKLLTEAVKTRGITFGFTPEIEIELQTTGADNELVQAIKEKAVKVKPAEPIVPPVPVATPPVQDFAFFRRRADENIINGDYDSAVGDYSKAIELNPKDASTYLNRGRAYHSKTNYDSAIADFTKAIEINPKSLTAYLNRGDAFEKKDDLPNALSDYQKAVELDANNESAKNNLKRLQAEQAKTEQFKAEQAKIEQAKIEQAKIEQAKTQAAKIEPVKNPVKKAMEKPVAPSETINAPNTNAAQSVEVGQLNGLATKLAIPTYPEMAKKMLMQGKITVQVALDEQGNVMSAKASNGQGILRNAAEDAARKSQFKPTVVGGQAVKATGFIVYNFVVPQ